MLQELASDIKALCFSCLFLHTPPRTGWQYLVLRRRFIFPSLLGQAPASFTFLPISMPPGNRATQEVGTLRCKPRVGDFSVDLSSGILAVAFLSYSCQMPSSCPFYLVLYLFLGSTVAPLCISRIMTFGSFAPMGRIVTLLSSVHPKQARAIFLY